jgi:hypothetical protein
MAVLEDTRARRAYRSAWICLCLLPVTAVAAMVLGDWLLTRQGYESGSTEIEPGAALTAGGPALLVMISPTIATVWFGLRARHYRHPAWKAPVLTAAVLAAAGIGLNLVQVVVALLTE